MSRSLTIAAALFLGIAGVLSPPAAFPLAAQTVVNDAAVRTATFSVPDMYCALCPVTVKTAMLRVEGVKSVEIDFDTRTATVIFDPSIATSDEIAAASTNVGYPAHAIGS